MPVTSIVEKPATGLAQRVTAGAWIPSFTGVAGTLGLLILNDASDLGYQATEPSWQAVRDAVGSASATRWAAFLGLVLVSALALHAWQGGLVRAVLGTPRSRIASCVMSPARKFYRWRQKIWSDQMAAASGSGVSIFTKGRGFDPVEHAEAVMKKYPAEQEHVTATRLGNRLVRSELEAGYAIGFDFGVLGGLLLSLLEDDDADPSEPARVEVETYAVTGLVSLFLACLSASLLVGDQEVWLILPAIFVLAAWCCNRAAFRVAEEYEVHLGQLLMLHRFKLLEALRLSLPASFADERASFRTAADLVRLATGESGDGLPADVSYRPDPSPQPAPARPGVPTS